MSLGRHTYRFDKWMVRFLIAHALALEDKVDEPLLESETGRPSTNAHLERSRITEAMMMDIQSGDTVSSVDGQD